MLTPYSFFPNSDESPRSVAEIFRGHTVGSSGPSLGESFEFFNDCPRESLVGSWAVLACGDPGLCASHSSR